MAKSKTPVKKATKASRPVNKNSSARKTKAQTTASRKTDARKSASVTTGAKAKSAKKRTTPSKQTANQKSASKKAALQKSAPKPPSRATAARKVKQALPAIYFGIAEQHASQENAQAIILPCPFEGTTKFRKGTSSGPEAILAASQQIELFDDELWTEPYKIGIHTDRKLEAKASAPSPSFESVTDAVAPIVEFGKFPIIVGGDRTVTLGAAKACVERYQDLSVLQISAHADCRQTSADSSANHACVTYDLYKSVLRQPKITQVGIRSISTEEVAWMEDAKPEITIFWARQQERWNLQEIVSTLSDNVYLSIDVSGLDDSIMPSASAPLPGGLLWHQLIELVKTLCIKRNVVAADIVELAPIEGYEAPNILCAKLLYKIIGYKFALDLGVTKKYR